MAVICWRWNRHLENTGFYRRGMWRNMSKKLFLAVESRHYKKVCKLVDRGADVNERDNDGRAPLRRQ